MINLQVWITNEKFKEGNEKVKETLDKKENQNSQKVSRWKKSHNPNEYRTLFPQILVYCNQTK